MSLHVIFVAPFCMETTLRFVNGAARLPGVALSLISQEGADKLSPDLRSRLAGHWRVDNALDPQHRRHLIPPETGCRQARQIT